MKKLFLSGVVFTALAVGPALAADMPRKAPVYMPPPPPVLSWNGWYVGLNAGAHWFNNSDIDIVSAPAFNCSGCVTDILNQAVVGGTANLSNGNKVGFIGGGQIGYNWQVTNWLWGIEADFQGIGQSNDGVTATTAVLANNGLPIITNLD